MVLVHFHLRFTIDFRFFSFSLQRIHVFQTGYHRVISNCTSALVTGFVPAFVDFGAHRPFAATRGYGSEMMLLPGPQNVFLTTL